MFCGYFQFLLVGTRGIKCSTEVDNLRVKSLTNNTESFVEKKENLKIYKAYMKIF